MKRFQHLTIRHEDPRRLIALLGRMKEANNKAFKYLKTESNNYAKNIFKTVDKVACFKTERKTLFKNTSVSKLTSSPSIQYAITVTSIAQPVAHSPKIGQHWTLLQRSCQTF